MGREFFQIFLDNPHTHPKAVEESGYEAISVNIQIVWDDFSIQVKRANNMSLEDEKPTGYTITVKTR